MILLDEGHGRDDDFNENEDHVEETSILRLI